MIYLLITLGAIAYTSFFEWVLHRYVMHQPVGKFRYAFEAHAVVHHQHFKADNTYLIGDRGHEISRKIPMAWWNIIVLLPIASFPWLIASVVTKSLPMAIIPPLVILAYYATYERVHWCMHLPKRRRLEMLWVFRRLNGHHLLHHRYMHKNFNVVLPLADLCLGTLMLRAKTRFAQAMGDAIPNVQPRVSSAKD